MAKLTKAAKAEHEKAIRRATDAAEAGGFVVYAHPQLGFARCRVTHGTTIVVGGEGDEHWESHPEAKEHIGREVQGSTEENDDSTIVIPMGMAMQYEALGQVEILGRVEPSPQFARPKEGEE